MTTIRPEVIVYAQAMEAELQAHDDRPGWKQDDHYDLYKHLVEEVIELGYALSLYPGTIDVAWRAAYQRVTDQYVDRGFTYFTDQILHEAADVCNLAMMCADVAGALPAEGAAT